MPILMPVQTLGKLELGGRLFQIGTVRYKSQCRLYPKYYHDLTLEHYLQYGLADGAAEPIVAGQRPMYYGVCNWIH